VPASSGSLSSRRCLIRQSTPSKGTSTITASICCCSSRPGRRHSARTQCYEANPALRAEHVAAFRPGWCHDNHRAQARVSNGFRRLKSAPLHRARRLRYCGTRPRAQRLRSKT
jgi:hypothetical protein